MNVDKAKKRIEKQVKKGFKGYPMISLAYFGETSDLATLVNITLTMEEGEPVQMQEFKSTNNAREDETIQSVIVKMIERTKAISVIEVEGVSAFSRNK